MSIPVREWLWPNLSTFITTLLVLAFTYYLFKKHLFGPTRTFINKREKHIAKNIKDSQVAKENATVTMEQAQRHFDKVIVDSSNYLDKQMIDANKKAQIMLEDAKGNIEKLKVTTREVLANAEIEASKKLKKEVAKLSIQAASKILEKEIDEKSSKKLVEEFIKDIK